MARATSEKLGDKTVYKGLGHEKDGAFKRQVSSFRSWVSNEPGAKFPAEKDRYVSPSLETPWCYVMLKSLEVLYINRGCPWASRANLVRTLKGLEDIIQIVILDWELFPEGW
jgi:glutathionyl-hydroquinone reductase